MGAEITIAPAGVAAPEGSKGFFNQGVVTPVTLKTELLRNNLATFVSALNEVLKAIPQLVDGFKLDEIDVVVEVNGEGSLQLVGGVKVGASGGITLKLKR